MLSFQLTQQNIALLALAVVAFICIILTIISLASTSGLKRKVKKWKHIHATADLDAVYEKTVERVEQLSQQMRDTEHEMDALAALVRGKISTAQVLRYNAFSDQGSDLSFSVALIDDDANGVVFSSIYGRDESRTYAKPIHQGESRYALADEEKQVLQEAMSRRGKNR
jgi:hypothetical protein